MDYDDKNVQDLAMGSIQKISWQLHILQVSALKTLCKGVNTCGSYQWLIILEFPNRIDQKSLFIAKETYKKWEPKILEIQKIKILFHNILYNC